MSYFYPDFESPEAVWALTIIIQKQQEDPKYLLDDDCPYPPELVELLIPLINPPELTLGDIAAGAAPAPNTPAAPPAKWEGLEEETKQLYLDLKSAKTGLKANDASGQMAFFRTATSLLEKLVGLQERSSGIKELHEFKSQAFKVIDSVLTVEQRNQVLAIFRVQVEEEQ